MIYFLLLLLLIRIPVTNAGDTAVCFLTVQLVPEMLRFAEEFALNSLNHDIDVFIMVDNNTMVVPLNDSSIVRVLQIQNEKCIEHGYTQTMYIKARRIIVSSWDKALLYFGRINTKYSFIWFIEDDAFIPSVQAFRSIHDLYSHTSDLIIAPITPNILGNTSAWRHWSMGLGKLAPPWYKSMANAMGLSGRLLKIIADFVQWQGVALYHEFFIQTLALNSNMTVVSPIELNTLLYRAVYSWNDIRHKPNNWWHPVKSIAQHNEWRMKLAEDRISNNNNNNSNNDEWAHLATVCSREKDITWIEQRLALLVADFEQIKAHLSLPKRRAMRETFLCLADQCRKRDDSILIQKVVLDLADNAYKLPEESVLQNMKKSPRHLQIEMALIKNKEDVFQMFSNVSAVKSLRHSARNLTLELTYEIQNELKQQGYQRKKESSRSPNNSCPMPMNEYNNFSFGSNMFGQTSIEDSSNTVWYDGYEVYHFLPLISILCLLKLLTRYFRFWPFKRLRKPKVLRRLLRL